MSTSAHALATVAAHEIVASDAAPAEIVPIGVGKYAIPATDTLPGGAWAKLADTERERIRGLIECFRLMEAAKNLRTEAKALAFRFKGMRGLSAGSLVALYYKWQAEGWKGLLKKHHVNASPLPAEFVQYWRALCETHGRSLITAKEDLYRHWFSGGTVPGYGELLADGKSRGPGNWIDVWHREHPLEDAPTVCPGVPDGWSKTTLYTHGPTKIERRLATHGLAAAKPFLPSLVRDTSTLLPLQLLTMDDFEGDQKCWAVNPRTRVASLVKMTGLAVMDVATRRVIAVLMKPRFEDENGKQQAITRAEVRFLIFQVLRDYGVPAHGMTWLVENAAAAITTELELTLRNLFGGRIQVRRTGMIAHKTFANGFLERGGKPQEKGWIESRFNLVHNRVDALPGQKGANYLSTPGDFESKVQYTEQLIGQGRDDAKLTVAQIERLRLPFKSADEMADYYMGVFRQIDDRVEHKMGGFEPLKRWRRSEHDTWHEWDELSTLSPDELEQPLEWFPRALRESSRMRWSRLIKTVKCEKIAEAVLAMLLLTPRHAKTRKTGISFEHEGKGYSFADKRALALRIPEGTDVLCYFDPVQPHSVHVCDMQGRYLVEMRSLHVNIADPSAMSDATKHLSELYNSVISTVRNRPLHLAADAQLAADKAHNAAIVAENQPQIATNEATPAAVVPAVPQSPVRRFRERKPGLTSSLARDAFAPGPVHTPAAAEMVGTIAASEAERAEQAATAKAIADETAEREARGSQLSVDDFA